MDVKRDAKIDVVEMTGVEETKRKRSKRTNYTRRGVFTFQFKGRPRRALLWRKDVYREWFNYGLLFEQHKGGRLPEAFGVLSEFESFEDWWRDPRYGFELFCEPARDSLVQIVDADALRLEADDVLLKLNLRADKAVLVAECKKFINRLAIEDTYQSRARFQPSKPAEDLMVEKLKEYRRSYLVSLGRKQLDAIKELGWVRYFDKSLIETRNVSRYRDDPKYLTHEDFVIHTTPLLRKLQRHLKQVRSIFRNLPKGIFP